MTPAAQILIAILPLVAVVLLAVLTFFIILWDYRTKRASIDKGQQPVPRNIDDKLLLIGIVSLFVGVGLLLFFVLYNGLSNSLLGGIIPLAVGLGIITHYIIMHARRNR
ncbi:MAG TPA: hypothetical protein VMW69_14105 [Spirochaetia bacterium]|nr:hypothetical protein [Spirochaetia bacterium]